MTPRKPRPKLDLSVLKAQIIAAVKALIPPPQVLQGTVVAVISNPPGARVDFGSGDLISITSTIGNGWRQEISAGDALIGTQIVLIRIDGVTSILGSRQGI